MEEGKVGENEVRGVQHAVEVESEKGGIRDGGIRRWKKDKKEKE